MELQEMDQHVTFMHQLDHDPGGPVVLVNQFCVVPDDVDRFLEVWADDARSMTQQPGFVSTQLHRGTAGSTTFLNTAVWESASALGEAFRAPEFQRRITQYPTSTVATPHIFQKQAVPGICTA